MYIFLDIPRKRQYLLTLINCYYTLFATTHIVTNITYNDKLSFQNIIVFTKSTELRTTAVQKVIKSATDLSALSSHRGVMGD